MARPDDPCPHGRRRSQHAGSLLRTLAVFDFDGTITAGDSLIDFLRHAVPPARLFASSAGALPNAVAFLAGRLDNEAFKEDVLRRCFGGCRSSDFGLRADDYAKRRLPRLVRPAALDRLRWHAASGHRVVIITAGLEAYVMPWARLNGAAEVVGTKLEVDSSGRLTGRLDGRNCYGPEKVIRLRALVSDLDRTEMYVYGDSRGDIELLDLATYPAYRPFR